MPRVYQTNPNVATAGKLSGPRLAKVVGHADTTFMGGLLVSLIGQNSSSYGKTGQNIIVKYCPPFFGATNVGFTGSNSGNAAAFQDTQKSYGMSFVPPDVGVTVLCIFVEETGEGYWLGCVPDTYVNHMVPGIAASSATDMSPEDKAKYGSGLALPTGEMNRSTNKDRTSTDVDKVAKPVHPMAGVFLNQGLIKDYFRGPTTSTMRRSAPSNVYGISTPGPLDKRSGAKKARIGESEDISQPTYVSRVGGFQFVMDDGDERYVRKKPAGEGPPEYVPANEGGDVRIPISEYFRVRTRTGHQILLHNSEDLIYIGHGSGTSWIEMSSNGKIDIYAGDSVSIHSENDFNFCADRDINLEAGRNINVKAAEKIQTETGKENILIVGTDNKIYIKGNSETTVDGASKFGYKDYEINASGAMKLNAKGVNMTSNDNMFLTTTSGNLNLLTTGNHIETADKIYMNSIPATPATSAGSIDSKPETLPTFDNPSTNPRQDFKATQYQNVDPKKSIMRRIPMHEPWGGHENVDPTKATPEKTDREQKDTGTQTA